MSSDKHIAALRQIQAIVNEALREASSARVSKGPAHQKVAKAVVSVGHMSFDMNILAFMKRHGRGLSGPQKFTLLLARLVKGSTTAEVRYSDIKAQWNKMKSVLGGPLNGVYANRAKANGWIDSEKTSIWKLTSAWKEALA